MNTVLDPLVSEFATQAQADDYERWYRAKVQEAQTSAKPRLAHAEVARRMEHRIKALKQAAQNAKL
jgi:hypothetical protein